MAICQTEFLKNLYISIADMVWRLNVYCAEI